MKRLFSAFVLLSVPLLAPTPASAFVRTITERNAPVHWPNTCVTVMVRVANPPPNLTPELAANAARAAAATWSRGAVSCTSLELTVVASDQFPDAPTANDQLNNLVFRQARWDYDPQALAITTVFAQQANGAILDSDIELNAAPTGKAFKWGDLVAGLGSENGNVEDLQNTLTHEFGHLLGLDHNCYLRENPKMAVDNNGVPVPRCEDASALVMEATMFASVATGDTARRTLAPDDIAGVCAIYPAGAAHCGNEGGGDDGGCAVARSPAPASVLALAPLALALGLLSARRRQRRTRRG